MPFSGSSVLHGVKPNRKKGADRGTKELGQAERYT